MPEGTVFCGNCGWRMQEEKTFCPECGAEMPEQTFAVTAAEP